MNDAKLNEECLKLSKLDLALSALRQFAASAADPVVRAGRADVVFYIERMAYRAAHPVVEPDEEDAE